MTVHIKMEDGYWKVFNWDASLKRHHIYSVWNKEDAFRIARNPSVFISDGFIDRLIKNRGALIHMPSASEREMSVDDFYRYCVR